MKTNNFYRTLLGVLATVLLISCGNKADNNPDNKQTFPAKGAIYLHPVPIEHQADNDLSAEGILFLGNGEAELISLYKAPKDKIGTYMPCKVSYDPTQKVLTMIIPNLEAAEGEAKEMVVRAKYDETKDTLTQISSGPRDERLVLRRSHLKQSDLTLTQRSKL